MRQFIVTLGVVAAIGAIGGWLSASGGGSNLRNNDAAWILPDRAPLGDAERLKLYAALMRTEHFGAERETSETEKVDEDNAADLPRIAATWSNNGRISLSFEHGDDAYITAGVGDALPGGWIVQDATLDRVILKRNGEVIELTVFPHDNAGI